MVEPIQFDHFKNESGLFEIVGGDGDDPDCEPQGLVHLGCGLAFSDFVNRLIEEKNF